MEELTAFLGFSLGASATIGLVRLLGRGVRATAVEVTRAGLRTGDAFASFRDAIRKVGEEARAEMRAEPGTERTRRRRGEPAQVRTIEVATQ
jgi:hypothetical protein